MLNRRTAKLDLNAPAAPLSEDYGEDKMADYGIYLCGPKNLPPLK